MPNFTFLDPRARKREQRTDLAVKRAFYRLADETRETILVACSKCDWRAAFLRRCGVHYVDPIEGAVALYSSTPNWS